MKRQQFDSSIIQFSSESPNQSIILQSTSNTANPPLSSPLSSIYRFFIPVMSESIIVKNVFSRMGKRMKVKAATFLLFSKLSTRMEKKARKLFTTIINEGGLKLLNEIVIDTAGVHLANTLKLFIHEEFLPTAVYCTAGKDRTGLIMMLLLKILGASDEMILADYALSDSAYGELNDKKAMVASLKQSEVDADTFLRAYPEVMKHAMDYVIRKYGSVEDYLSQHGFTAIHAEQLR
jgi:hypothetical protein